jgi:hypothetical protein
MIAQMAGSAVLGAATKAFGIWMNYKQKNHEQTMMLLAGKEKSVESARKHQSAGAAFGRRFITIMSFCLLAFLVMVPAFLPEVSTNVPVESWVPWVDTTYTKMEGLIAYEVLMEILVSVTCFYMGSATIGGGVGR